MRGTEQTGPHLLLGSVGALLVTTAIGFAAAALGNAFRSYSVATIGVMLLFAGWAAIDAGRVEAGSPTPWGGNRAGVVLQLARLVYRPGRRTAPQLEQATCHRAPMSADEPRGLGNVTIDRNWARESWPRDPVLHGVRCRTCGQPRLGRQRRTGTINRPGSFFTPPMVTWRPIQDSPRPRVGSRIVERIPWIQRQARAPTPLKVPWQQTGSSAIWYGTIACSAQIKSRCA